MIASAISQFYKNYGALPLPGSVPDMKAQSADYIALQNIYKSKARSDVQEVLSVIRSLEKQLGRTIPIEESEVEAFCKNAGHIKLVRGQSLHIIRPGEKVTWGSRAKAARNALTGYDTLMPIYIAFLAFDAWCATHKADKQLSQPQPPGVSDEKSDAEKMVGIAWKIVEDIVEQSGKKLGDEEGRVKEQVELACREL